ncbi:MAG: arylesterase [Burkholderiales bacterium]|nr:MAG: arylesterase [Burkholderiales bacterium]
MSGFRESRRRFVQTLLVSAGGVAASLPVRDARPADASAAAGAARETAAASTDRPGTEGAPTVLVLGDSVSAEYGLRRGSGWVEGLAERLRAQRPPWSVVNASVSGETTAGGRSRIASLLARHEPRIVVVELGGNDALRGLDLRATEANLDAIAKATRDAGAAVLLLGMQVPPNYGAAYADAFTAIYPRVADRYAAKLVPFFLAPIAGDTRWFQPDRIHPTEAAQPLLLDVVWPALAPLLRASAAR